MMKYFFLVIVLALCRPATASDAGFEPKSAPKGKLVKPKPKKTSCEVYTSVVNQMVNYLVYPYPNQIVLQPQMLSSIFDPTVKLRVTPVGEFTGYMGVIEYFYGLTIQMGVTSADIVKSVCAGNVVAIQANVHFGVSYPGTPVYPGAWNLTLMGFFTFDEMKSVINSMEVSLLNFGAALDRPNIVNSNTGFTYQQELMAQVCGISVYGKLGDKVFNPAGGTCMTGPLRIWQNQIGLSDYDYCMAFLSGQIPSPLTGKPIEFGSYNRLNSNTVVCRSTHVLLSVYEPEHHCPHVSPNGGGKCIDFPYSSFYDNVY
jgi:hypothetical protein